MDFHLGVGVPFGQRVLRETLEQVNEQHAAREVGVEVLHLERALAEVRVHPAREDLLLRLHPVRIIVVAHDVILSAALRDNVGTALRGIAVSEGSRPRRHDKVGSTCQVTRSGNFLAVVIFLERCVTPGVQALRFLLRESLFPSVRAGNSSLVVYGALVRAGVPCCCWGTESG